MRSGDGVIRRRKGQLGIVDRQAAALDVKQAARAAEVMQQMAIDMEEIGVLAHARDDMLVPYLGQHGAAGFFHGALPLLMAAFRGFSSGFGPEPSKHRRPPSG